MGHTDTSLFRYRPEVDGLRALAVLGVLFFHAGLGFPGGYAGVDVFFVISGYLITGIILRDLREGSFSMPWFWTRRIRRILPALAVMALGVLALGVWLLDPAALAHLGLETAAQPTLLANVFFFRDLDYFAPSAEFKPLLHTWSLAVEEQFYLVFPLVLWAGWKGCRRALPFLVAVLAAASFAANLAGMKPDPGVSFYLLHARAWELLAGSLVALTQERFTLRGWKAEGASTLGLLLIAAAFFGLSRKTAFPGTAALLPVAGALLIIVGDKDQPTRVGRLLALRPVVGVGLISYSLYLWHWPLLVFARMTLVEQGPLLKALLLACSFPIAFLSWKYVENPVRTRSVFTGRMLVFTFAAAAALVMAAAGWLVWRSGGFPSRLEPRLRVMAEDMAWFGEEYMLTEGRGVVFGPAVAADPEAFDYAVLGDSHGMVLAEVLRDLSERHGVRGLVFLRSGSPLIQDMSKRRAGSGKARRITEETEAVLRQVIQRKIRHVLVIHRWASMCEGMNAAEREENPRRDPRTKMLGLHDPGPATPERAAAILDRQMTRTLRRLNEAGATVWILKQVPEADRREVARRFYLTRRFPRLNRMDPDAVTRAEHEARQARAHAVLDRMASDRVRVLDPAPFFFPGADPLRLYGERSYYRDDDHLTRHGATVFVTPVLDPVFAAIAEDRRSAPVP